MHVIIIIIIIVIFIVLIYFKTERKGFFSRDFSLFGVTLMGHNDFYFDRE